jgi:hypothetical protein
MTKPLPKSLHTITVLTKLAVHFARVDEQPLDHAMERLLRVLGYDESLAYNSDSTTDPYALVEAAMPQAIKACAAEWREAAKREAEATASRGLSEAEAKREWDELVAREEREADRCIDVSHK